jgi:hypothetical protein
MWSVRDLILSWLALPLLCEKRRRDHRNLDEQFHNRFWDFIHVVRYLSGQAYLLDFTFLHIDSRTLRHDLMEQQ